MSKCKRCADHLKADCKELKAQLEESSDTIRYVTGQRDEAWSRQDAAVAERDALKAALAKRADPPQPYIDGALAWLASIEDELDTLDNMQLWGRMFGWLEAQR